jgi:hypothetical protein
MPVHTYYSVVGTCTSIAQLQHNVVQVAPAALVSSELSGPMVVRD